MAMGSPLKALMNLYTRWLLRREYRKQKFKRLNERPIEFAFLFRMLTEHIEDSDAAVRHIFKLLNPGGHLLMSFPCTERS